MTNSYLSQLVFYRNSRRHQHRLGITLHQLIYDPSLNVEGRILYVPNQEDKDCLEGLLILAGHSPDSRDIRVREPNTKIPSYSPYIEKSLRSHVPE